jgi:hypothetical protein
VYCRALAADRSATEQGGTRQHNATDDHRQSQQPRASVSRIRFERENGLRDTAAFGTAETGSGQPGNAAESDRRHDPDCPVSHTQEMS